jgi:hypothetical protein
MLCKVTVLSLRPGIFAGARGTEETLKKELAAIKNQLTAIKERSTEVCQG